MLLLYDDPDLVRAVVTGSDRPFTTRSTRSAKWRRSLPSGWETIWVSRLPPCSSHSTSANTSALAQALCGAGPPDGPVVPVAQLRARRGGHADLIEDVR